MKKSNLFTILALLLVVVLAASVLAGVDWSKNDGIIPDIPGDSTGDNTGDNSGTNNNTGTGNVDSTTCLHSSRTTDTEVSDWQEHIVKEKCVLCDEILSYEYVAHSDWNNGVCGDCGYACKHDFSATLHTFTRVDDTYHLWKINCSFCGYNATTQEEHILVKGQCIACTSSSTGSSTSCTHKGEKTTTATYVDSTYHIVQNNCSTCGQLASSNPAAHSCAAPSYEKVDTLVHTVKYVCDGCNSLYKTETKDHTFVNGVCSGCNTAFTCTHVSKTTTYETTETQHTEVTRCDSCSTLIESKTSNHTFVDGVCSVCNYDCAHSGGSTLEFSYSGEDGHGGKAYCAVCGAYEQNWIEIHSYINGVCSVCNYNCAHDYSIEVTFSAADYHEYFRECSICGSSGSVSEPHNTYVDGDCVICGYPHTCDPGEYVVESVDHYQHYCKYICKICGEPCGNSNIQNHFFNEDGVCTECQYETCGCDADDAVDVNDYFDYQYHGEFTYCQHGTVLSKNLEEHTYVDDVCTVCGGSYPQG